jgi:hypothetical protein
MVSEDGGWIPAGHGSAAAKRNVSDLTDVLLDRAPDPRAALRRKMYRELLPLMTSAGWRTFAGGGCDKLLDFVEATYRDDP